MAPLRGCICGEARARALHEAERHSWAAAPPHTPRTPHTPTRPGCYSLARLLDEGVIAGCEGDVCAALGMLWAKELTGQVSWMANVAQVDPVGATIKLAHVSAGQQGGLLWGSGWVG